MAQTKRVALATEGWTLLADGSIGVTELLVQVETSGRAKIHIAGGDPGAAVDFGISINDANAPFSARIGVTDRVFGRGGASVIVVTM